MNRIIVIEDTTQQEDILSYAGWKLYNHGIFPENGALDELMMKKEENGKIIVKTFTEMMEMENENKCFNCALSENIRKISKDEVAFQLTEGVYKIPVNDSEVELDYQFSKEIYVMQNYMGPYKKIFLKGSDENVRCFIAEMDDYIKMNDKKYIKIYNPTSKGYWECLCKNPKRDVNTVFIDRKKEVLDDLEEFLKTEEDYHIFGHPYKRNYLFYGPPGNGKTSFINAIASKFYLNIYLISFSNIITDELFKKLVSGMPKNALLVMEDIDQLFDGEKKNLSMSTVLNTMDGLARKSRVICVMTTNHFDKLTDVFKRPGRMDMLVEFGKADLNCFREMAKFMCEYGGQDVDGKQIDNFYESVSHMKPSRALVQKFLFENRKKNITDIFSQNMVKKFKDVYGLYSQKKEVINIYS